MPVPQSTYRLQLGPRLTFADVAGLAPYLGRLGISHVYLSPILTAAPGSTHGYDVVDHSTVSAELGGEAGLRVAAAALASEGIGVIVDIVPNHAAIPVPEYLNPQVWSLLRDGPDSSVAAWFDVHWSAAATMLLPLLGQPLAACLRDGELNVDGTGGPGGEAVLRYYDHVFPLRPGTEQLPLDELVRAQHYELATWRRANDEVNYRRFFDVDTLLGLRVERPDVFDATHATLLRLHHEGVIEGFRIDHIDGLADPPGYLKRLAAASASDTWTVVEKILLGTEQLPPDWQCAGTTGYDALWRIGALFVDPTGVEALHQGFAAQTGEDRSWPDVEQDARRHVLGALLGAEVARLVELAHDIGAEDPAVAAAEPTALGLGDALVEVLVHFPVYRLYASPGEPVPESVRTTWHEVVDAATTASPHRAAEIELIRDLAIGAFGRSALKDEFVRRLQQTCGPAVAKGVEDTATYWWSPLSSMNEVGAPADSLGVTPDALHAWVGARAVRWPNTMNALTTHDTKRGEDVRARIAALSEQPQRWLGLVARWTAHVLPGDAESSEGRRDTVAAWLLWQTLWGAWPISGDRLSEYVRKAAREAKQHTSWLAQNANFEAELEQSARTAVADERIATDLDALQHELSASIVANTLGARAIQLLLPGVPDVYQGTEQVFLRLVDPDNRQPPDWATLAEALDQALEPIAARALDLDAAKLRLTALALRLRRDQPEAFGAADQYAPLVATGLAAQHFFGFRRGDVAVVITRLAGSLAEAGGWADTQVALPTGRWTDLLTEQVHDVGPGDGAGTGRVDDAEGMPLGLLLEQWPVAILVRAG